MFACLAWLKVCVRLCDCVCVDSLGYVYVCECYVALDECDEPILPVCAYGGVVRYFGCFRFLSEFCLYCDYV